jgi:membrane fusion protein (multidrug efflux system)
VRVTVPALDSPDAIRIPQRAVTELQGNKSVFVVAADGKAQPRQIVATHRLGNDWIVASGIEPGDRVVVDGIGKVKPGAAVKAVPPTAEPSGGSPSAPTTAPQPAKR